MDEQRRLVERALGYPYAVPSDSFLLAAGRVRDAGELGPDPAHAAGRRPLLAYGSNAAPEVLARKLGASLGEDPVLALRASLADFDVVYSAHISRYGSIPAALQRSPGTEVAIFVVYLTGEQLRSISPTEPNYELETLRGGSCTLENGEVLTEVTAYMSRHGCLLANGSEVALAAVEARGRRFPALTQPQVLEHVRATLAPKRDLERFVIESASDPELARQRTEALKRGRDEGQAAANLRRAKRASRP